MLAAFLAVACRFDPPSTVTADIKSAMERGSGATVRLDQSTDFDWDSVAILGPYVPQNRADEIIGFSWPAYRSYGLEKSDGFHLVVFIKDRSVVRTERLSRSAGDFDGGTVNRRYPRSAAQFVVRVTGSSRKLVSTHP